MEQSRPSSSGRRDNGDTLFVRNLPYDLTHAQLEALFEDVGPVKSAFVIADQKDPCKIVFFVSFMSLSL